MTIGMTGITCPVPFRGATVPGGLRPKEIMLLEEPKPDRSPVPLAGGDGLGLIRRVVPRVGIGLPAGRNAVVARGGLLASLPASLAVGASMVRDRCGLAVGRGDPLGRTF